MNAELLAERVTALADPAGGVDLAHAGADVVERGLEVLEVLHGLADLVRVAVDEFVGLLGLAGLLLTGGDAGRTGPLVTA
nr:hypothetical protein [Streptomyces sp. SID1328]